MVANIIIVAIIAVLVVYGVRKTVRRAKGSESCCGGGSGAKSFKTAHISDTDESHYPYTADYRVAGMSCENCAKNVTNALDSIKGTWATVDLASERAHVRSKNPIDIAAYQNAVEQAGYKLVA